MKKLNQGFPGVTILSTMLVLVMGQISPASFASPSYISNESSVQAATKEISFQDGVYPSSSYRGTRDVKISQNEPDKNFGSDSSLGVDGDDPPNSRLDKSILLSWDLSSIPKNSTVKSASITLRFDQGADGPTSGDRYSVYQVKRAWEENQATWNKRTSSLSWSRPGASGTTDRYKPIASFTPSKLPEQTILLNANGIKMVQAWVDNPSQNFGLLIASSTSTDGADFLSSETSEKRFRPKLTISYEPQVTISSPPRIETNSSMFRYQGVSSTGADPTVIRSISIFGGGSIQLTLYQTVRLPYDWSVVDHNYLSLSIFDQNSDIQGRITEPNGIRSGYWSITSQQLKSFNSQVPFQYGMGQPPGTYTMELSQSNRKAWLEFTIPEKNDPDIAIWPKCVSPGRQFTLATTGLPKGTPLDIYRHDRNTTYSSYWKYENSIQAPEVNELGQAYYTLKTSNTDPRDSYLIIARDTRAEARFDLPCR